MGSAPIPALGFWHRRRNGYAAEHYGVECVGITISKEQTAWAQQRYAGLPLGFRLQDYRTVEDRFDRIVSIGMFEHIGRKNYHTYMHVAHRCLADGGLFLLYSIGKNQRDSVSDTWADKYIFPNGDLPSIGQIGDAVDGLFVVEDIHNFGTDYDKTLMAWHDNFEGLAALQGPTWRALSPHVALLFTVLRRRFPHARYTTLAMGTFQGGCIWRLPPPR